jgi:putative PIG3 family NAD(P)H quinone oxidoreductase
MAKGVMRAIVMRGHGGPEVLVVETRPLPQPRAGEVRVRVAASGVNRADLSQRRGRYPAPPGWPADIPGLEYAGVVDDVGPGVEDLVAGERVMGIAGGGAYAEALVVPAREVVPVPAGLDLVQAGAVPEAFFTAWDALVRQMRLGAGETVLIHAAGSGVGTAAVQIARAVGARSLGTSRTPSKLERAVGLGLDGAVGAGEGEDWPAAVLEHTGGRGVDVILDLVGGTYAEGNLRCLAARGRWIVVGVPSGRSARLDLRELMARRASVTGTVLRARAPEERALLAREAARRLTPLLASGALAPVVDATYAPDDAAEAHRRMEADLNFGKLVIVWNPAAPSTNTEDRT